jgi:uncharacterized protein YcfJ
MKRVITGVTCAVVTAFSVGSAVAQTAYDDAVCRQYADQQIAPLRDQANANAVGSALVGAALGAGLGAAVGGGRGAGIGAASGAIVGTGAGVANAQGMSYELQQRYGSLYSYCMSTRAPQPPAASYSAQGYPAQGYPAAGGYPYGYPQPSGYGYPYR